MLSNVSDANASERPDKATTENIDNLTNEVHFPGLNKKKTNKI